MFRQRIQIHLDELIVGEIQMSEILSEHRPVDRRQSIDTEVESLQFDVELAQGIEVGQMIVREIQGDQLRIVLENKREESVVGKVQMRVRGG